MKRILLIAICVVYCQGAFCEQTPLEARTSNLRLYNTTVVNAVLAVAKNANVPLGVVCADKTLTERRISLDIPATTVGIALSAVAAAGPGLTFTVERGVVVVEPSSFPAGCNFLNDVVPEFVANRDTVEHLSTKLWMTLEMQIDPARTGFAGVLHPDVRDRTIGPTTLRNARVRDILDWIIAAHAAAAWIGHPCDDVRNASTTRLWNIVFYSSD